jgi:hypothetical protein
MKEEMNWMSIWIFGNTVMAFMSLLYLYLSHELHIYGMMTVGIFALSIIFPYTIWKYNQIKFIEKNHIVIHILKN